MSTDIAGLPEVEIDEAQLQAKVERIEAGSGEQLSEAETARRVQMMAGSMVLNCTSCGRDCKHVPKLPGGGTAGGEKGTRWEASARSSTECPSCMQKPHRKEGRPHQCWMCLIAQVANHNSLTGFPKPSVDFLRLAVEYVESGMYQEPPTEQVMTLIVNGMTPEAARELVENNRKARETKRAENAKSKPVKLKDKLTVTAAPGEKAEGQHQGKGKPVAFTAAAAGINLKAEIPQEEKPEGKKAKKRAAKAEREAKLLERAETEANKVGIPEPNGVVPDTEYDPFANIGEPFPVSAE